MPNIDNFLQRAQPGSANARPAGGSMNYKFQRLREKIRLAVINGELHGKLPGERELARQFQVNTKTLSKALTDLAAEGLLQRTIGRGTFVSDQSAPVADAVKPWLILSSDRLDMPVIEAISALQPRCQVAGSVVELRPSFIAQFSAVICLDAGIPQSFLRDLVVRNLCVVTVGHRLRGYSTHAVMPDTLLAMQEISRRLLVLEKHRHLLVVEPAGQSDLLDALRSAAVRAMPAAVIDIGSAGDCLAAVNAGATAIVCSSTTAAREVMAALSAARIAVPARVTVLAIGSSHPMPPCSGYFVQAGQIAQAVGELIRKASPNRPATLWLSAEYIDAGRSDISSAIDAQEVDPPFSSRKVGESSQSGSTGRTLFLSR